MNYIKLKKILISAIILVSITFSLQAQFGYGFSVTNNLYNRYTNPEDPGVDVYNSAGSFLLNLGVGPKIWVGGEDFSFSAEGQGMISFLGLATSDYKGLGMSAFPVMGKFNFGGLSGLNKEGKFGFSIGAGVQWSRTELYGLRDNFAELGVTRDWFRTYVGEIGYGFGLSGFSAKAILRYGYDPDSNANTFNFGIQYDFNLPKLKEITDPASEL
jgi:hypothetical protein